MSASSDQLEVRRYQAGQVIIREGDESTEAFIVRAGTAEVVKRSAAGKDVVLATLDAGSIFGEMGLVQDRPRSATVRARTEVEVDVVDVHSFNALFASDAARRLRPLLQGLFERLRTADTRLAELESATKEQPSPGAVAAAAEVAEEIGSPDKFSVEIIPQTARAKQVLGGLDRVVASRFPFRIGRIEEERGAEVLNANELSLRDEKPYNVSRSHCALAVSGGICYFQDRGSRVGSVVAGERIGGGEDNAARKALKIGDNEICLGTRRGELLYNFRVSGPEAGILQRLSGRLFG